MLPSSPRLLEVIFHFAPGNILSPKNLIPQVQDSHLVKKVGREMGLGPLHLDTQELARWHACVDPCQEVGKGGLSSKWSEHHTQGK